LRWRAIKFAVLPSLQTFRHFASPLVAFLYPIGFCPGSDSKPSLIAIFTLHCHGLHFMLSSRLDADSYDTAHFNNSALAIVVGCGVARWPFACFRRSRRRHGECAPALPHSRDLRRPRNRLVYDIGDLVEPHSRRLAPVAGPVEPLPKALATAGGPSSARTLSPCVISRCTSERCGARRHLELRAGKKARWSSRGCRQTRSLVSLHADSGA